MLLTLALYYARSPVHRDNNMDFNVAMVPYILVLTAVLPALFAI